MTRPQYRKADLINTTDDVEVLLLQLEEGKIRIDEEAYDAIWIVDPDFDDLQIG
jgi:hypothetical protein